MNDLHCPQCGEPSAEFNEGVCQDCWTANQNALDLHNIEYDRWQRMSDSQRGAAIRSMKP